MLTCLQLELRALHSCIDEVDADRAREAVGNVAQICLNDVTQRNIGCNNSYCSSSALRCPEWHRKIISHSCPPFPPCCLFFFQNSVKWSWQHAELLLPAASGAPVVNTFSRCLESRQSALVLEGRQSTVRCRKRLPAAGSMTGWQYENPS